MRGETTATWLIGALAAVAVVLGLVVVGGPGTGRAERRDATRERDIYNLSHYVNCTIDTGEGTLPTELPETETCTTMYPDTRRADPFTGKPYRFERLSDNEYRLCADFELTELARTEGYRDTAFDPATGCRSFSYRPT